MFSLDDRTCILKGETSIVKLILGGEAFPTYILNLQIGIEVWNIYGTTECSVWASLTLLNGSIHPSIGNFLNGVSHEIIYEEGESEIGELWIGGSHRKCYIDNEEHALLLRPTGDLVQKIGDDLIYIGRTNQQIKLMGHRINLDVIAGLVKMLSNITQCE